MGTPALRPGAQLTLRQLQPFYAEAVFYAMPVPAETCRTRFPELPGCFSCPMFAPVVRKQQEIRSEKSISHFLKFSSPTNIKIGCFFGFSVEIPENGATFYDCQKSGSADGLPGFRLTRVPVGPGRAGPPPHKSGGSGEQERL